MSSSSCRAVVDASVAVKMFVPEDLSEEAQAVFERHMLDDAAGLIVPDLFFVECANVFWKWVQRTGYPARAAKEHLDDLVSLDLLVIPARALSIRTMEIALEQGITAYDACYLAAAFEAGAPLVTADRKLVGKIGGGVYDVRWLGEIDRIPT